VQIQKQELTITHTMHGNINYKRMHSQDCDTCTDLELRILVQIGVSDRKEADSYYARI
jgi:hypothetical protein